MKTLVILFSLLIISCSALNNPQGAMQPVVYQNLKEKIYFTTCSGAVEDWNSCIEKARRTCSDNYAEIKRYESPVAGRRELTFQCK
jgi:hypothetical protein